MMVDAAARKKIERHFRLHEPKKYPKGSIIIFAEEEPAGIFFLTQGLVEQYDITPAGNKVTVNLFKPPAFFPMSWAINKTPNTYFFAAVEDSVLQVADTKETVEFLKENPDVMFDLLSRVYRGADALLLRISHAASGIAVNRLIVELVIEAHRFGKVKGGGSYLINTKQQELAARCGLARETISREMHRLEREGCLEISRNGILLNLDKLKTRLEAVFRTVPAATD